MTQLKMKIMIIQRKINLKYILGKFLSVINQWKKIIKTGDVSILPKIIHNNAIFYSPVVFTPQSGKDIVVNYLSSAVLVFKDKQFEYINEIITNNLAYIEFEAEINNIKVNGLDCIKFSDEKIEEFKVFLRPYKGLEAVWTEMKKKLKYK